MQISQISQIGRIGRIVQIGFPLAISFGLCAVVFYEHFRHFSTRKERFKRLREDYWGQEEEEEDLEMCDLENINQESLPHLHLHLHLQRGDACNSGFLFWMGALADSLTLPITLFLGWLGSGPGSASASSPLKWKQKVYHSLVVAGRFVNPFVEWQDKSTTDVFAYIKWQLTRTNRSGNPSPEELERNLPVKTPNFDLLYAVSEKRLATSLSPKLSESWIVTEKLQSITPLSSSSDESNESIMTVTWIGQSTCFIQMDGYNILTDPIFTSRTLTNYLGPKRLCPVPCSLADLPPIDIILVSHNHYDHLDISVLTQVGNKAAWYVPKGMKQWMAGHGVDRCVELDWWQEYVHDDRITITGAPAQHWSGRHFFDVNSTLWASFVVKSRGGGGLFHCGDSGYCTVFKEIGDRYGPFTLSLLPIGSYEPRYFMQHQHMCPKEAAQVSLDLQSTFSLGVHWGTFMMSDEHYMDPKREFEKARDELGASGCFTLPFGETRVLHI